MDFLKKKPSPDDDDIIELTDIIEERSEDSSAKSSTNQAMETQMDSLFNGGNNSSKPIVPDDMDADIDALLAEMQPAEMPPAASSKAAAPSFNVDEELDMPNMSEVDALLKGMDIPPQPTEITESTLPSAAAGESLDDLLDGLLDGTDSSSANAKPAAAPSPSPQTSAAPIAAESPTETPPPASEAGPGMNLDDLDALFAELAPPQAAATPPPAAATPVAKSAPQNLPTASQAPSEAGPGMNLDDLDALFAELAPPQAAATPPPTPAVEIAAPVVAAASKIAPASPPAKILDNKELSLDDELDALLGETSPLEPFASEAMLVAEEQQATENDIFPEDLASPAPAASAVDNTHGLDDLDALFAELAPPQVAAKPAPTPVIPQTPVIPPIPAAPAATAGDNLDDLDDLDALFTANAQDRAHTPPASPEEKSPAAPATADSSARFQSIEDDLDDILGSVDPATAPASPASRTDDAEDEPVDLSDLGTMSADEAEDFLANIFDTEKNAPKNSTALEADLLDGLDVLDGLDDPIQPGETIISPSSRSPEKQLASSDTDTLDFSMLSVDNPADMPAMPAIEDAPIEDTLLPELDELDKLLQDSLPTPPSPPISQHPEEQAEELAFIEAEGPRPTSFDQDFTEEDIAQAAQELLDEKVRETASIDNVDTDAWLSSLDAILEEEEKEDFPDASSTEKILPLDDDSAVNLDSLLAHLSDSGEQTQHYVYSPQRPHNSQMDANNTASPLTSPCDPTVPTMPFELAYEQELARLQQITDRFTSSLLEADVRIATLTQQAKSEVALESLFRADSPFSASLQHAVGTAVAAELRTHSHNLVAESAPPAADPKAAEVANQVTALELAHQELQAEHAALIEKVCSLEEQLHSLHSQGEAGKNAQQSTQERLSALEDGNKEARLQTVETHVKGQAASTESLEAQCAQLQAQLEAQCQHQANFEQHFQHEVEKAAAAAAARIIREEIAGILAGQE